MMNADYGSMIDEEAGELRGGLCFVGFGMLGKWVVLGFCFILFYFIFLFLFYLTLFIFFLFTLFLFVLLLNHPTINYGCSKKSDPRSGPIRSGFSDIQSGFSNSDISDWISEKIGSDSDRVF